MATLERKTKQRTGTVCPVCKQPVDTVLERRKTLGIFVPVWKPGPCRNPDCVRSEAKARQDEPEVRW
jgi:hypothetical protein